MKNIEAVIPHSCVRPTVEQLQTLDIQDVIVESVKVFKKDLHQTMVYRGCRYDQEFVSESKIRFLVTDQDALQAETIVAQATRQ